MNWFGILMLTAGKELRDLRRDPRSLAVSLALPLILFPLLFRTIGSVGTAAGSEAPRFTAAVEAGSPLQAELAALPGIVILPVDGPLPDEPPPGVDLLLSSDSEAVTVVYDNSDSDAVSALGYLESALDPAPAAVLLRRPLYPAPEAGGRMLIALALPFMIFIFAASCPLPLAADLSAGEKERRSLEPLLATAAPRGAIAAGKLLAAAAAGSLSVAAFFAGVGLSIAVAPSILGPDPVELVFSIRQMILLPLLTLLATALFASLELTAGIAVRSVREAQLLGMPLLVAAGGAVQLASGVDLTRSAWYLPHLPLINLAVAVRQAALDRIDPGFLLIACGWGCIYLAGVVLLAQRLLSSEKRVMSR